MAGEIFISFASQDRRVAMTLCTALEGRGFKCWISTRDIAPGENFQIAIVRAIRSAKLMLLVFTANSNNSDEMSKELALASQNKLMVVPLRIEDVAGNDAFAYEFATRQWIDFFADWEVAIQQLADRIGHATGAPTKTASEIEAAAAEITPAETSAAAPPVAPRTFESEAPKPAVVGPADSAPEDEAQRRPKRIGIYAVLTALLVLIVGAGVLAPGLRRAKTPQPEIRTMIAVPMAVAPAPTAAPAGADAAVVPDQLVAPTPKKKRLAKAKVEDDVPY